jgi:hypothetical protein
VPAVVDSSFVRRADSDNGSDKTDTRDSLTDRETGNAKENDNDR